MIQENEGVHPALEVDLFEGWPMAEFPVTDDLLKDLNNLKAYYYKSKDTGKAEQLRFIIKIFTDLRFNKQYIK